MTHLLSFDIGIRNMAYCYASVYNNSIDLKKLNKVDLNLKKNSNTQTIINTTIDFLDNLMDTEIDTNFPKLIVLIECQMTSIMKCIQTTINTFFKLIHKYESLNITTINLSPKFKLSLIFNIFLFALYTSYYFFSDKSNLFTFMFKELVENLFLLFL